MKRVGPGQRAFFVAISQLARQSGDVLAVIIPTLNESDGLPSLLSSLDGHRVVISDGGSSDDTLSAALSYGAVIARGLPGRGVQLARGAELAGAVGDVDTYLFLHADSGLLPDWAAVVTSAALDRTAAWHFRFSPEASGPRGYWLRFIVWLRCWAWKLPYGDQGLLIPREMYEALGGYDRKMPLFEDVDIIDRIKSQFGRNAIKPLPMALKTDVSAHIKDGVWTRGWRNYRLLRAFRRGVPIEDLMRRYT